MVKFLFLTQIDEDVLLLSHTSSMKHHLTETHEHNFEIHNIVLSSQSISLTLIHIVSRTQMRAIKSNHNVIFNSTGSSVTGADPGFLKRRGGGPKRGSNFGPNVKTPTT